MIAAAARDWKLPEAYVRSVERWSISRFTGARMIDTGRTRVSIIRHMIVHGRVQGVGFRAFVEDEALARGLEGWVRNRRDGSVEAVFVGDGAIVAAMIEACRKGPFGARVDVLHQREGTTDDLKLRRPGEVFSVLPTGLIGRPEQRLKFTPQHRVHFRHGDGDAEIGQAGDAVALLASPRRARCRQNA